MGLEGWGKNAKKTAKSDGVEEANAKKSAKIKGSRARGWKMQAKNGWVQPFWLQGGGLGGGYLRQPPRRLGGYKLVADPCLDVAFKP